MKKKSGKRKKRVVKRGIRGVKKKFIFKPLLIGLIILYFLVLVWVIIFILEKASKPPEEGLEGELPSLGIFGVDEETGVYFPENCSDEELKKVWDSIFLKGSSEGIQIISNKDANENCNYYFLYNISNENIAYLVYGDKTEENLSIIYQILGVCGNLTSDAINFMHMIDGDSIDSITTALFFMALSLGDGVQSERSISSINEANNEFLRIFKVRNGSWEDLGIYYAFSNKGEGLVYKNKTLNVFSHNLSAQKPIDLTQIKAIENIVLNGSEIHNNVINLDNYFVNLGYDGTLSFSYELSPPTGDFSVDTNFSFPYGHNLNFNTSKTIGGVFTMDISLSHPNWGSGAEIVSNNFDVTIYGCLDSDENNGREKGITSNLSATNKEDYCVNNVSLMEYYCENTDVKNVSFNCGGGESCNEGVCIGFNNAPRFINENCGKVSFYVNNNFTIDMNVCFVDLDGNNLTFRYDNMSTDKIGIKRSGNSLTFVPQENFTGDGYFYMHANDSINETQSSEIKVEVKALRINISFNVYNQSIVNKTNETAVPKIISSSPLEKNINMFSNESKKFEISAKNYDMVEWYLDDELVSRGASSFYEVGNLSEGNHVIKVEVKKGGKSDSETWNLNVVKVEEPKKIFPWFLMIIVLIILGIAILLVVLIVIRSLEPTKNKNVTPIVLKTRKVMERNSEFNKGFKSK